MPHIAFISIFASNVITTLMHAGGASELLGITLYSTAVVVFETLSYWHSQRINTRNLDCFAGSAEGHGNLKIYNLFGGMGY